MFKPWYLCFRNTATHDGTTEWSSEMLSAAGKGSTAAAAEGLWNGRAQWTEVSDYKVELVKGAKKCI